MLVAIQTHVQRVVRIGICTMVDALMLVQQQHIFLVQPAPPVPLTVILVVALEPHVRAVALVIICILVLAIILAQQRHLFLETSVPHASPTATSALMQPHAQLVPRPIEFTIINAMELVQQPHTLILQQLVPVVQANVIPVAMPTLVQHVLRLGTCIIMDV